MQWLLCMWTRLLRPHRPAAWWSGPTRYPRALPPAVCTNALLLYPPPQARYVVERADMDLWLRLLADDNASRKALIDQVRPGGISLRCSYWLSIEVICLSDCWVAPAACVRRRLPVGA